MGLGRFDRGGDLGSRPSSCRDYGCFAEAFSVLSKSVSLSVADLFSFEIRRGEAMSREYILEGRAGALGSSLSSNNTRIGK